MRRGAFSRRAVLSGGALLVGTALLRPSSAPIYARELPPPAKASRGRTVEVDLSAAERPMALPCFEGKTLPTWTFAEGAWPPVIRLKLGDRLQANFRNALPREGEHASIHWHGIRLPNAEDGVPYLTQPPVPVGESHRYEFTPPDTGTYFFHTHCNTVEQLGRGLVGILIVDGDTERPYDADETLAIRDWRIGDGGFLPFYTAEGAGKGGTFGTARSVNGAANPEIALPPGGDCRLRLLNVDPTRIMEIGIEGTDAAVVAIDGVATEPFPLETWRMGPANRLDLVVRAPGPGKTAQLLDYFSAEPVPMARLAGRGKAVARRRFDPAPLRAGRIPVPNVKSAERIRFDFSAGGATAADPNWQGLPLGTLCESKDSLWAINKRSWPAKDGDTLPPPLATLTRGKSYVFELANLTPQQHPIHIHGHTFAVLGSNKRKLPRHHADTVLLLPNERIEVAFVADNPGNWMLHCHLIEHQESGMMGYLTVA